ncbi:MFS transporter, partial [Paraburkholderia sp. Se-20369]|nr:MFS transporter [Paraburkholderia sp. Se-20369]
MNPESAAVSVDGADLDAAARGTPGSAVQPGLSKATALLFAVACGLAVANVYFDQPLLDLMARDFGISHAAIGIVITVTQIGYGAGLLFVVPLGDLLDRRRLIV